MDSTALKLDPELIAERGGHSQGAAKPSPSVMIKKAAIVVAVTAFVGVAFFSFGGAPKKPVAVEKIVINKTAVFEPAAAQPIGLPVPPARPTSLVTLATQTLVTDTPKGPDMLDAARRAPVVAFTKQNRQAGDSSTRVLGATQDDKPEDGGTFEKLMKPTRLDGARAGHLGNRDFVIAMGTSIPCVLETALSSDQPGFATCVINRDVLSDNGRVVLLEKGSQVIGEYRGGLKRGQARLFVLWNRAKTPTGVIVTLGSPATDALGRAGFDGEVDNHWWERIGSALLLSVVTDASQFAGQRLATTQNVQANSTTQSGKQAAAIAVEQSAAIVPTLNKRQGELVNIMVGRDLDFTRVYRLRVLPPDQRSTAWEAAVQPIGPVDGAATAANLQSFKD